MPLPQSIGRFNRLVTNRITELFAGRLPPFAIVEHTGRKSGKGYSTPIMAFPSGEGFVVALTYGAETDWVRNVLAAGSATFEYRNRRIPLTDPRLIQSQDPPAELPWIVRIVLGRLHVTEYLMVRSERRV